MLQTTLRSFKIALTDVIDPFFIKLFLSGLGCVNLKWTCASGEQHIVVLVCIHQWPWHARGTSIICQSEIFIDVGCAKTAVT